MKEEIEWLERDKERRQTLQRLYTRIEHIVTVRPPSPVVSIEQKPTRILSYAEYRTELVAKAEIARARVTPEYRPRLAAPSAIINEGRPRIDESRLGHHFQTHPPADNGGFAEPPPPIVPLFNKMANPPSEKPYKQKVTIGFGIV